MPRDEERIGRIQQVLSSNNWNALVCTLPENVLLLSGYWPVIGSSVAMFQREGAAILLVPDDERELAQQGWADEIRTFESGSLSDLKTTSESACEALGEIRDQLRLPAASILGFEGSSSFEPSSYASNFGFGAEIQTVLGRVFPVATLVDAAEHLNRLRSAATSRELGLIRRACHIARNAFVTTSASIEAGMREWDIAALLRSNLGAAQTDDTRCDGFAYCMSGPNSAQAFAAFQHTRSRAVKEGDFILLHCNSYCGGLWTDITRTFCIRPPDSHAAIIDAVLEASQKAISVIRPGITAAAVDDASRGVLTARGYGKAFRHATGHGVGFAAINHNAPPRIHPLSQEVLESGMVFNVEPAVYIPGVGGMRQCNMVAVNEGGVELLTPFQNLKSELILK